MKYQIQLLGFIFIIIGMIGLLTGEFLMEHSSTRTLIFGGVDFLGLALLCFAHWGMREKAP